MKHITQLTFSFDICSSNFSIKMAGDSNSLQITSTPVNQTVNSCVISENETDISRQVSSRNFWLLANEVTASHNFLTSSKVFSRAREPDIELDWLISVSNVSMMYSYMQLRSSITFKNSW